LSGDQRLTGSTALQWDELANLSFYFDSDGVYRAAALAELSWLEHGFGTRRSPGWLAGRSVATLRQIHSDIVRLADGAGNEGVPEGDGLAADRPDCLIGVRTADCLPILIADERRQVVAAVHAGWRGSVAGIGAKAVAFLERTLGSRPVDLRVAIGPGIGPCCFEVGPEVAGRFREVFPERMDLGGRARIDLVEVNRRHLRRAGVSGERITSASLCTRCEVEWFESFRRDGEASGRMLSAIGIRRS